MQYRFVISQSSVEDVFREALLADVRKAKLSWRFRAYYQVRSAIPLSVRHWMQHHRPLSIEKDWYLPHAFLQKLKAAISQPRELDPIIHPWPSGRQFAVVLTHDVETAEGLANVPKIASLEEELGFRSSWNLVPHKYEIDPGLVKDLKARGFEIGIHGYNHDGKLYFSKSRFARRAQGINKALDRYGATGFRSPMVHRRIEWLSMLNIEYDASFFDIDPYQATPGGVGSIWPFLADGLVILPYTLPQDHTLFIVRGEYDDRVWRRKLELLKQYSGLALMLTHPDYMTTDECLGVYRRFLLHLKGQDNCWQALPQQVTRWWKDRDESCIEHDGNATTSIAGPVGSRGRLAQLCSSGDRLFRPLDHPDDVLSPASLRNS